MAVRGIRGATTAPANTKSDIVARTKEMLETLVRLNDIRTDDIASAIFSVTEDLNAEFPAVAARQMGWLYTPLFCTMEIPVQGSLKSCIRVLLHVNTDLKQEEMKHVYLHEAEKLRPDLGTASKNKFYTSEK
ncbi:MAG TPA: chorismate mutase [Spirochaetota bacterium]|nr:chorismate mutase [Spirochaetota bacterium]HPC40547.1 chorismate mutase [Spirochaetota bacterium]HPL17532.1 chorismate mutase [Spirochaetota bacterium]HQF07945.1 chorismate mutase [Spirochaetota bacterium]HQH96505.1 chorismate mutase [Spirochaetota bacterium]